MALDQRVYLGRGDRSEMTDLVREYVLPIEMYPTLFQPEITTLVQRVQENKRLVYKVVGICILRRQSLCFKSF